MKCDTICTTRHKMFDNIGKMIDEIRDSRRPSMQLVRETVENAFEGLRTSIKKLSDDGTTVVWQDLGSPDTLPKYYILTESTQDDTRGFPLMTVRQAFSFRLDCWLSLSSLIVGQDRDGIAHSIAFLFAQHLCAFGGVRLGAATVIANDGDPTAAVSLAAQLLNSQPPSSTVDLQTMLDAVGMASENDGGDMN